jgi:LacI family transcriptional regulator
LPTIHDVARLADVSIATVSRVLNDSGPVSDEAQRRVLEAAARLDYWPNGAARSLTTRRTQTLGVLLPDLYGEFFSEVIRGIDHAARRERLQVLISSSHADTEEVLSAARAMRGRVDGLLLMSSDEGTDEAIRRIRRVFPVVLLNPRSELDGCASVSVANFEGARAAVEHLIALGHRDIAIVKGPAGNVDAGERLRGYRAALGDAGREPAPALEFPGDFTESSGDRAAEEILRRDPRPTAVFAANDSMAIGLLSALAAAGIEVPREMAVVGFDDLAFARYVNPPLTTVHVDAYRLGERAVRLMLSHGRADGAVARHEVLPAPLVVRRSCGSEASGRPARARREAGEHGFAPTR